MAWSVKEWKDGAARRLRGIGAWLGRSTPYAVYSALCGLSLWPLVEAARGEGILPVLSALAAVAGGVGGNLIAEQIQRWRDVAQAPSGDDGRAAVEWVAERAPEDAELRQALDQILEALGSLPAARAALEDGERAAFDAALRQELARLGSLQRFAAELEGAGAIAQGRGAMAAGQGGAVVQGGVGGNVETGSRQGTFVMDHQQVGTQINVDGNLVLGQWPEGGPEPLGRRTGRGGSPAAEKNAAASWDSGTVRRLLAAALSDHELDALCYDHFRPACDEFAPQMGKAQKIQRLLAYCERYGQTDKLLGLVEKQNPAQYERFRRH